MKNLRPILLGGLLWVFIFVWWSLMVFIPGLKDMPILQYLLHYVLLIVAVSLITKIYYKKKNNINGFLLGVIFLFVGIILDMIITIPLFTIPQGTGYISFFFAPLMIVGYVILVLTAGITRNMVKKK